MRNDQIGREGVYRALCWSLFDDLVEPIRNVMFIQTGNNRGYEEYGDNGESYCGSSMVHELHIKL